MFAFVLFDQYCKETKKHFRWKILRDWDPDKSHHLLTYEQTNEKEKRFRFLYVFYYFRAFFHSVKSSNFLSNDKHLDNLSCLNADGSSPFFLSILQWFCGYFQPQSFGIQKVLRWFNVYFYITGTPTIHLEKTPRK